MTRELGAAHRAGASMTADLGAGRLWEGLLAAGRGERTSAAARAALKLSVDEGRPRLGWLIPVPLAELEARVAAAGFTVPADGELLIITTGGWAFAASAVAETADPGHRLSVVDTLDATSLARHLTAPLECLAISASGQTYETRLLAEVIADARRSRTGRGPHWLSEATVPGGFALRPGWAVTATLGAPLSVPFALVCAAAGMDGFRLAYDRFFATAEQTGRRVAELACAVPSGGTAQARLTVVLPAWVGYGVRTWALQALRQGLGGKPGRPVWCDVSVENSPVENSPAHDETGIVRILLGEALAFAPEAPLAGAMTVMYATAVLTACLGIRYGIPFASHPAVARYKALLHAQTRCHELTVGPGEVTAVAARWLAERPELAGAHLVCYSAVCYGAAGCQVAASALGRTWETHVGSRWNHHSYQAFQADRRLGLVAVAAKQPPAVLTGDDGLDTALRGLHARQLAIARATCASLPDRALLILVDGPGRES
jgi:hypothetical protein